MSRDSFARPFDRAGHWGDETEWAGFSTSPRANFELLLLPLKEWILEGLSTLGYWDKGKQVTVLDTVLCAEETRGCNFRVIWGRTQCFWLSEESNLQTMPENTAWCFKLCGTGISYFNLYHLRLWHTNYLGRHVVDGVDIWKTDSSKVSGLFLFLFACLMSHRKLMVFCAAVKKRCWVKSVYLAPSKADHHYAWVYGHCRFECGGGNSESLWGLFFPVGLL